MKMHNLAFNKRSQLYLTEEEFTYYINKFINRNEDESISVSKKDKEIILSLRKKEYLKVVEGKVYIKKIQSDIHYFNIDIEEHKAMNKLLSDKALYVYYAAESLFAQGEPVTEETIGNKINMDRKLIKEELQQLIENNYFTYKKEGE